MITDHKLAYTEKFFVYVIKNDVNTLARVFTDIKGIATILNNRGETGVIAVIRSVTNQYAVSLGDAVVWMDCPDVTPEK
jgi:hypothetical protein